MFNKILCSALAATLAMPIQIADAQCFDRWGNPTACPVDAAPSGYHVEKRPAGLLGLRTKEVLVPNAPAAEVVFEAVSPRYSTTTVYEGGDSTGNARASRTSHGGYFAHNGPMTAAERQQADEFYSRYAARYGTAKEPAAVVDAPAVGSAACDCPKCEETKRQAEQNAADIKQIKRQLGIRAEVDAAIKDSLSHRGPTVSRHAGPSVVLTSHRGPSVVISPPSDPGYSVAMR